MKMPKLGKIGRSAACILLVLAVFVVYEASPGPMAACGRG